MKVRHITLIILSFIAISIILWTLALNSMEKTFFAGGLSLGGSVYSSSEDQAYEKALIESVVYFLEQTNQFTEEG